MDPAYHWPVGTYDPIRQRVATLHNELPDWQKALPHIATFSMRQKMPSGHYSEGMAKNSLTTNLSHLWEIKNIEGYWTRTTVHLMFCLGIALLLIPSIFTFCQVTWVAVKHILNF